MPMVEIKGAHRVTSKGRVYWYAWRGKDAPRIYATPGTQAFLDELAEKLNAHKAPDKRTVKGLCARWRASDFWQHPPEKGGIAHSTRKNWSPWLSTIEEKFGALSVAQFDRPQIKPIIRKWRNKYKATPRAADMAKQVLSALLTFAVDEGDLQLNPCIGMPNFYHNDRSEIIWEEDDLARLTMSASAEIGRAAHLASLTGLRQSDLLKLSWSHVGALAIELRTGKSGEKKTATIPMYGELRDFLASLPQRSTAVLTNQDGFPWKSGFTSSWNKAMLASGLSEGELHFHDLRGTAATRMYVGGIKVREIASIFAWSEDKVERIIARYVNRDALLKDMIRRLDEAGGRGG